MIRVVIVDDHPAVRLGLQTALAAEPGLVPVGAASTAAELPPLLRRVDADVVLLDYQLPDDDGLTVCRHLKSTEASPAVIIYSAFADAALTVPAIIAGADGLVHKSVRPLELFEAIRAVAAGGVVHPVVSQPLLEAAGLRLDTGDPAVQDLLLDRTAPLGGATVPGIGRKGRVGRMLARAVAPFAGRDAG